MKTIKTDLNISDTGIIIDLLIESGKECESVTTANWCLEIINKVTAIHEQLKETSEKSSFNELLLNELDMENDRLYRDNGQI